MIQVYWNDDFESMDNVFFTTDQYFDDCIDFKTLQQPIYQLLIRSIDNCILEESGVIKHISGAYTTTIDKLSTGLKQTILVLYTSGMEGVPSFLASRFGDNCWDWVFLFSHLQLFKEMPLSICMDCIPMHYDATVKFEGTSTNGLLINSPIQLKAFAQLSLADVEICQSSLDNSPVYSRPRNPPYFDAFRCLCQSPEQVFSISDLNSIANKLLAGSEQTTNLFSQ